MEKDQIYTTKDIKNQNNKRIIRKIENTRTLFDQHENGQIAI